MEHGDIPCHVFGCLYVSRWGLFDERDPEQSVCLCKIHMEELRITNPSRAENFVRIAKLSRPVSGAGTRAA